METGRYLGILLTVVITTGSVAFFLGGWHTASENNSDKTQRKIERMRDDVSEMEDEVAALRERISNLRSRVWQLEYRIKDGQSRPRSR